MKSPHCTCTYTRTAAGARLTPRVAVRGWWAAGGRLGGAEGGASDEALYREILAQVSSPWAP